MYSRPPFLFNRHLETIFPALFRKVNIPVYKRERINTSDSDFLDLDWLQANSKKLVVISHGLEGNTHRAYVKGMARLFFQSGFDILAWNYRGCSGEINRALRFYHSGATDDLHEVIVHGLKNGYSEIYLVGFSLGGNLTLKYLGERLVDARLIAAVTFSVPLELHTSCLQISKPGNTIYEHRFLKSLKNKVVEKSKRMGGIDISKIKMVNSLYEFDDHYTAPLHGYKNALDYYTQCSALHYLKKIQTPTLIVNAKNDTFLSKECFPQNSLSTFLQIEYPNYGGHVGFSTFGQNGVYWSEQRALDFILKR
ncbi:MAG: alpha/beta fold hydrolase [Bacteroidetes bacterium]|nr:alpha/beta fold hydrolase [Bacteroidota bacterium]